MAASVTSTITSDGAPQTPSATTEKKSRKSSSKSKPSELASSETKKKSKTIFGRFAHTLKGKSKSKSSASSETSSPALPEDTVEIPVSRDAIPSIIPTGKASQEALESMLIQVQTTLAVARALREKLSLEKPIDSLNSLDDAMSAFFEKKQAALKLTDEDATVITPRGMIKHVVTPFHQVQTELSPLDAIQESIRSALDNHEINLSYNAPDWIEPVLENPEMFEAIGRCPSAEALTAEQIEFLEKIYLQIGAGELETLKPMASPRPVE